VYTQGGMNWGNIAVYTCSKACDNAEYSVVQEPLDELHTRPPRVGLGDKPVVVAEGTKFEDDDEEEKEGGDESQDDDSSDDAE
jgi:hypothetical protein